MGNGSIAAAHAAGDSCARHAAVRNSAPVSRTSPLLCVQLCEVQAVIGFLCEGPCSGANHPMSIEGHFVRGPRRSCACIYYYMYA